MYNVHVLTEVGIWAFSFFVIKKEVLG